MKKIFTAAAVLLITLLCLTAALAVGGEADDPLISLSYLKDSFTPAVDAAAYERINKAEQTLREDIQERLTDMAAATSGQTAAVTAQELTLNQGDTLSGGCGLFTTPLAGQITLTIHTGAVIDVSTGEEVSSGVTLAPHHRYLAAENAAVVFTAASPTAILSYQGSGTVSRSTETADYYGIAVALRSLDLFRGTGSGIGDGFDLHLAPTRAEALIMFIRILGEEEAALACPDSHPFTDVPAWLDRYAAWAYARGYTNGVAPDLFGTQQTVTAVEFQEFLLRALGYSVAGVDDYRTSLERALTCGVLTDAEYTLLTSDDFCRAHVAYLSYYMLETTIAKSTLTLGQYLQQQGVFTLEQLDSAKTSVSSLRLR